MTPKKQPKTMITENTLIVFGLIGRSETLTTPNGTAAWAREELAIVLVISCPGAPTEIRKLDGNDYTLSTAVKNFTLTLPERVVSAQSAL